MPPYIAVVKYDDTKTVTDQFPSPPGGSTSYSRDKHFTATYQADPSGTWTSAFHGVATDNYSASPSGDWIKYVYDWSNAGKTTHQTDSYLDDTTSAGIIETYGSVTGLPDQDLQVPAPGGPGPWWVYHYYASGVRHKCPRDDGGTASATVTARTQQKLFTGGKAKLKRRSLIHLSASAWQYGKPPHEPWLATPSQSVDPRNINVLGH